MFKTLCWLSLGALLVSPWAHGQADAAKAAIPQATKKIEFGKPVRLAAGGKTIRLEQPGFASPCLADLNGDGKKDLLVGQFAEGKIRVYPGLEDGKYGEGSWLMAAGEVAKVDGVW